MNQKVFHFLFLSYLFCGVSLQAAFVPIGAGGYTTELPTGRVGPSDDTQKPATPKVTANFSKPPRTNQWWSSLIWRYHPESAWSEFMFAHPLAFKAQSKGLEIGYPTNYFVTPYSPIADGTNVQEYHYPWVKDFLIGVAGLSTSETKVSDYTDWTVTATWADNAKNLNVTMGSGLPFVYVTQSGGNAVITVEGPPQIWANNKEVIGMTVNGHHYGIFAPAGSTWSQSGNQLSSNLANKNYYSVAILPDNQAKTLELFRQHAYAFVTNTTVTWEYNESTSGLTSKYAVETVLKEGGVDTKTNVNRPLLALYRHQWLNSKDPVLDFKYVSAHGEMKVVDASQFTTELTYSGVLPFLPNFAKAGVDTYNSQQLYNYIDEVYKQPVNTRWQTGNESDTYWMGKSLCRIAHLIPIAEQVQHTAAKDLFIAELKSRLQDWFDGTGNQLFYYNANWRTLIGYPASYGSDTILNDHHFHYGYFIMASAILAHYDSSWAQRNQWGGMVEMLIKDVANSDRSDDQFPFLRCFDVYAGHGWASGPAEFGSGNNEESSSEEVNFHSALILWGSITGNKNLRDLGIFLYTTATSAIPQYWFDVDNEVFPNDFVPNTLGMVWSDGGAYATWFGGPAQFFHGINFLPINPGMLYLGKYPSYLKENQAFMLQNAGSLYQNQWRDIHMSVRALYNPQAAITEFNQNLDYSSEAGMTKAYTYHWIHNNNQLGRVTKEVTANIANYAVFTKDNVKHHVAYNPSLEPITVNFSDGVRFVVPARSMLTDGFTFPEDPNPDFSEEVEDGGEIILSFKPNLEPTFVILKYKINDGSFHTVVMELSNKVWQYVIPGLRNGDKVEYTYIYEHNGIVVDSDVSTHVYKNNCVTTS